MAGAAWPETHEPTASPMAQNGSVPSTLIAKIFTACMKVSGTFATKIASTSSNNEMIATNSIAITARANR